MSTALFLTVNKKITTKQSKKINQICESRDLVDVSLCFVGMYEGIKGKTYFFDSMWIPFLKPLQSFEGKTDNYEELKTVFYASLDIIKFLLGKGYEVRLFLNSVGEEKTFMHNKRTIMLSELNEQTCFDWATIYELFISQI